MKNDLSIDVLLSHLRGRRAALEHDLREVEDRAAQIRGAIEETRVLEQQATNGMIAKSRLSCE